MTPAEQKARALVLSFLTIGVSFEVARQCSLIYVKGIQNELNMEWNKIPGYKARWQYWEEIKTAIEQMP